MIPIEGEPLRYYVRSFSRPRHLHLVDLAALNRHGECGCERFQYTLKPMVMSGAPDDGRTLCKHLQAVLFRFGKAMVNEVADRLKAEGMR